MQYRYLPALFKASFATVEEAVASLTGTPQSRPIPYEGGGFMLFFEPTAQCQDEFFEKGLFAHFVQEPEGWAIYAGFEEDAQPSYAAGAAFAQFMADRTSRTWKLFPHPTTGALQ